jgi:hypothetical protein
MRTIEDIGPAKLQPPEEAEIRFAADSLLFCADIINDEAPTSTGSASASSRAAAGPPSARAGSRTTCGPAVRASWR